MIQYAGHVGTQRPVEERAMVGGVLSRSLLVAAAALWWLSTANAGVIDFDVTSLGGTAWRYGYTIRIPPSSDRIDQFTIYFDVSKYELLSDATAPAGWDPLAIQPDTAVPADGYYDALSLGGLLGSSVALGGFSVSFYYLGSGVPGAQPYDLLDSTSLSVIYSGRTTSGADAQVPEPASPVLVLTGLACALGRGARRIVRQRGGGAVSVQACGGVHRCRAQETG